MRASMRARYSAYLDRFDNDPRHADSDPLTYEEFCERLAATTFPEDDDGIGIASWSETGRDTYDVIHARGLRAGHDDRFTALVMNGVLIRTPAQAAQEAEWDKDTKHEFS